MPPFCRKPSLIELSLIRAVDDGHLGLHPSRCLLGTRRPLAVPRWNHTRVETLAQGFVAVRALGVDKVGPCFRDLLERCWVILQRAGQDGGSLLVARDGPGDSGSDGLAGHEAEKTPDGIFVLRNLQPVIQIVGEVFEPFHGVVKGLASLAGAALDHLQALMEGGRLMLGAFYFADCLIFRGAFWDFWCVSCCGCSGSTMDNGRING